MKKLLLFICFCLCAAFVSAQRTLNWKISFESGANIDVSEIIVTVNNTDTCSFIESIFFPSELYSKTVESYGNIYKTVEPFFILDILNMFTEHGWNVDNISYKGVVSGKSDINISLISVDGSPKGFFDPINKERTYMYGIGYDDDILVVYPPFVSKAHIRYMKPLEKRYDGDTYVFNFSSLRNINYLYLCGWRIDFLGFLIKNDELCHYFFFSHEYEPEE